MPVTRLLFAAFVVFLLAAMPGPQAQETGYDAKMREAEGLLERRDYEQALRVYKDANALQGKRSPKALIGMARAYQGLKAYKSAADSCTEALKHASDDKALEASARNLRGVSLFTLAEKPGDVRWKQAEEDFRFAMAMVETYPVAQYNLGLTLMKQLRDDEGIRELSAFVERAPRMPEAASAKKYIENPRRARENFAPDFSFATLDGEFMSSDDLRGKVVLIDFWATWCPPCVTATPGLARLQKKHAADPFVIIGVSADRDQTPWKAFIEKHKLTWTHYYDDKHMMSSKFRVAGFPTYILIDHEGIIQYRQQGWSPMVDAQIEGQARSLIKRAKAAEER